MEKLINTSNCIRYSNGSCIDGDCVSKCVGMDCCGAYEPSCSEKPNDSIPNKCRRCLNFSGSYCEVHQHLIEDAANCSEFNDGEYSEEDMSISIEHLREVLEDIASVRGIVNDSVDFIIERVKDEI